MGRFLAVGIPAQINIVGKRKWDESKLEIVKKEIGKYTDLNLYEETLYTNGANYKLKQDVFKKNIYQTLQEFDKFTSFRPSFFLWYLDEKYDDLDYSKLNQKDYPCKLVYNHKDERGHLESGFQVKENLRDFFCMCPPEDWLVADCDVFESFFDYDCEVSIRYVPLWHDFHKYCGEDESNMLRFLNRLKIPAFRDGNPLTKTIMFFVLG